MDKKIDPLEEIERRKTTQPSILKCSYKMARKIRSESPHLRDLNILTYLSKLNIKPSDRIPDHIVFLCDERGATLRMINLAEQEKHKKPIIIGENQNAK